jgi:hypothetical protein
MAKTKTSTLCEIITERYENPDFAPVIRHTEELSYTGSEGQKRSNSNRRVCPDTSFTHAAYCKALVLALARYGTLMELPYIIQELDQPMFAEADALYWYHALTDDNPPGKVSFRRGKEAYQAFRDLVMPLDFRVFDADKAEAIRSLYRSDAKKTVTVDADLIIQGELGELDEKP